MNKIKKRLLAIGIPILLIVIIILMVIHNYAPLYYRAKPIEAWVIDAETKRPIEGIVVVAYWQLEFGTFGGSVPVGLLKVMETVTDKNGRFYFPGWGPKLAIRGVLFDRSPTILLFKSGYSYQELQNYFYHEMDSESLRQSQWNGKTIEMKKFKGSLGEYYKSDLMFLGTSVGYIIRGKNCNWKQIPQMVSALLYQERLLTQQKILNSLYTIDQLPNGKCGSPKEILKDYLQ